MRLHYSSTAPPKKQPAIGCQAGDVAEAIRLKPFSSPTVPTNDSAPMHCRRPFCRPSVPMWPCPSPLPIAVHRNRVAHLLYVSLSVVPLRDYFLLQVPDSSPLFPLRAILTHILLGQPLAELESSAVASSLTTVNNLPSVCSLVPPSVRNILKSLFYATTWACTIRTATSCFCRIHATDDQHNYHWMKLLDTAADSMTDIASLLEDKLADTTSITSTTLPCGCTMLRSQKFIDTADGIALIRYAQKFLPKLGHPFRSLPRLLYCFFSALAHKGCMIMLTCHVLMTHIYIHIFSIVSGRSCDSTHYRHL